ncbi:hypothetical protein GMOD_00004536 [Pyrenophora seminiperda CCB06]|uniref:SprT-like domain-containing protein n=1 Tax=Pyrenophora seminiperda CCB06 TaxID=1302712 RepID=A0A3M7MH31_9PLEO|nr:hypothetical protein GMOD_00004536 [Pyrenophora seminiperda CCB06]
MGKSSAADAPGAHHTVEKKKRRRLHPVRRIAKFLLGRSKQKERETPGTQHEHEGKTCHGASRWQNVLPFLEPLIALDPKLSFIQDRILKRPAPTANEKEPCSKPEPPRTLQHVQQRVQDEDVFCDCDECAPKYYKVGTAASHGVIRDVLSTQTRSTKCSFLTQLQLKTATTGPRLDLTFHGTYEAMSLVRHHMAWLDATYIHPSASPTPAVKQLRALVTTWHPHLSSSNLRHTLSTRQLNALFTHLNTVFFNGCVPPHNATLTAGFSYLSETSTDCFGKSFFNPLIGTQLLLHPCLYRGQHAHPAGVDAEKHSRKRAGTAVNARIATLLHEMAHAYLKAYACASCPTHDASIGKRGHGRAWQLLAAKIEHVASVVLGHGMDLGRVPALLRDVAAGAELPSWHDLGAYGMLAVREKEQQQARRELGREDSGVGSVKGGGGGDGPLRSSRGPSRAGISRGGGGGGGDGDGRMWWLADSTAENREMARRSVRLVLDDGHG